MLLSVSFPVILLRIPTGYVISWYLSTIGCGVATSQNSFHDVRYLHFEFIKGFQHYVRFNNLLWFVPLLVEAFFFLYSNTGIRSNDRYRFYANTKLVAILFTMKKLIRSVFSFYLLASMLAFLQMQNKYDYYAISSITHFIFYVHDYEFCCWL